MGSYQRALNKIGKRAPVIKRRIEQAILDWSGPKRQKSKRKEIGAHITENIDREYYLPVYRMESILRTIHKNRNLLKNNLKAFETAYLKECYRHVMRGPQIKKRYPNIVGRAVTRDGFKKYLRDRYNLKDSETEDIVQKLLKREKLEDWEEDYLMTPHSAWVTWNDKDKHKDENPFYFAHPPYRARKIRANLGLDSKKTKGVLLLLVYYTNKPYTKLLIPTIADAGTHEFFRVAGNGTAGSTKPWYQSLFEMHLPSKVKQHKPHPHPEAVHEPEELRQIDFVEIAT